MQKWEYMTIQVNAIHQQVITINGENPSDRSFSLYERLKLLGQQGWEVIAAVEHILILKRPLS